MIIYKIKYNNLINENIFIISYILYIIIKKYLSNSYIYLTYHKEFQFLYFFHHL